LKIIFLLILTISMLLSKTTICYKENSINPKINNSVLLDGGDCQGKFSLKTMKQNGWDLQYAQATKQKNGYNHLIFLSKDENTNQQITQQPKKVQATIDLDIKEIKIKNIDKNIASIEVGNLIVGQSGIVIHKANDKLIIVGKATVKSSSNIGSTLILSKSNGITQNAIPTSKLKPQIGDTFVLNHTYNSSLLIVPNFEASQEIKTMYPKQNFFNPDIFASHLKIENLPSPKLKDIQEFCKSYDIGTLFIVANNYLYILDIESLEILDKTKIYIEDTTAQSPFFTKVTNIKENFWDFRNGEITDYNNFYVSLINNTKYQPTQQTISKPTQQKDKKTLLNKLLDMLPW